MTKRQNRFLRWAAEQTEVFKESAVDYSRATRQWLEDQSRDELRVLAAKKDIKGRGSMNKAALVDALLEVT